jgi:hypothetical protein
MKTKTQTVYRSAITGRFVTAAKAKRRPKTTIRQRIKR